jgi:hypothetical protein
MSCSPCARLAKKCPPNVVEKTVIKDSTIIEEVPVYIPEDSAHWELFIECDENRNAILKELNESTGEVRTVTQIQTVYKTDSSSNQGLRISLNAYMDSIEVKNRTIKYFRDRLSEKQETVTVATKYVPRAIKVLAWSGAIVIIGFILYIVFRILYKRNRKFNMYARHFRDLLK